MPCNDLTEILRLTIDLEDRITGYSLSKISCGGAVAGRSLIRKWVKHRTLSEIQDLNPQQILQTIETKDEIERFLHLKHLVAIQTALTAFLGHQTGRPTDPCVINSISVGPDGTELLAELKVDILTDQIKACGRCGC